MCRFLLYKGNSEILLSKLILEPTHSILTQSYDCRLRLDTRRPHNGDGFGVGYYPPPTLSKSPCIFTSTTPAWNCINLERLASKTTSSLIFAHVRATTSGSLADSNCHPFSHGSLMFMHNGNIGAWRRVKRALVSSVGERWFLEVKGSTDSEWAFAVFLDELEKGGVDPSSDPGEGGFGHATLRKALLGTVKRINMLVKQATSSPLYGSSDDEEDLETRSLLNFAVTDGHSVVCTRYVSSKTDEAASLYFSSGTDWREVGGKGNFKMERRDKGADIVLVASEPLTFERDNWVTVPTNSTLTIHNQTVMIHPIIDEFYNRDPAYTRNSGFAVSKGLVSHGPGATIPTSSREESTQQGGCMGLGVEREGAGAMIEEVGRRVRALEVGGV
ncbi:MAG: hypothetical protein M1834_004766 [Cirrosporium novae-zelandiae]|nr:MAG: hypothetical protein M1834_004766 [Cirrosporium novae-zelandiae]